MLSVKTLSKDGSPVRRPPLWSFLLVPRLLVLAVQTQPEVALRELDTIRHYLQQAARDSLPFFPEMLDQFEKITEKRAQDLQQDYEVEREIEKGMNGPVMRITKKAPEPLTSWECGPAPCPGRCSPGGRSTSSTSSCTSPSNTNKPAAAQPLGRQSQEQEVEMTRIARSRMAQDLQQSVYGRGGLLDTGPLATTTMTNTKVPADTTTTGGGATTTIGVGERSGCTTASDANKPQAPPPSPSCSGGGGDKVSQLWLPPAPQSSFAGPGGKKGDLSRHIRHESESRSAPRGSSCNEMHHLSSPGLPHPGAFATSSDGPREPESLYTPRQQFAMKTITIPRSLSQLRSRGASPSSSQRWLSPCVQTVDARYDSGAQIVRDAHTHWPVFEAACHGPAKSLWTEILVNLKISVAKGKEKAMLEGRKGKPNRMIPELVDIRVKGNKAQLVFELCRGGEAVEATKPKIYTDLEAAKFARRVLETLRWLHEELKIMHRDLKPENLLFATEARNSDTAMLIDFGLACPIHRPETPISGDHPGKHEEDEVVGSGWSAASASASRLRLPPGSCGRSSCGASTGAQVPKRGCRGLAGTVDYLSPQQLWHLPEMKDIQQMLAAPESDGSYSEKGDVFALGAVLHQLIEGRSAFPRQVRHGLCTDPLEKLRNDCYALSEYKQDRRKYHEVLACLSWRQVRKAFRLFTHGLSAAAGGIVVGGNKCPGGGGRTSSGSLAVEKITAGDGVSGNEEVEGEQELAFEDQNSNWRAGGGPVPLRVLEGATPPSRASREDGSRSPVSPSRASSSSSTSSSAATEEMRRALQPRLLQLVQDHAPAHHAETPPQPIGDPPPPPPPDVQLYCSPGAVGPYRPGGYPASLPPCSSAEDVMTLGGSAADSEGGCASDATREPASPEVAKRKGCACVDESSPVESSPVYLRLPQMSFVQMEMSECCEEMPRMHRAAATSCMLLSKEDLLAAETESSAPPSQITVAPEQERTSAPTTTSSVVQTTTSAPTTPSRNRNRKIPAELEADAVEEDDQHPAVRAVTSAIKSLRLNSRLSRDEDHYPDVEPEDISPAVLNVEDQHGRKVRAGGKQLWLPGVGAVRQQQDEQGTDSSGLREPGPEEERQPQAGAILSCASSPSGASQTPANRPYPTNHPTNLLRESRRLGENKCDEGPTTCTRGTTRGGLEQTSGDRPPSEEGNLDSHASEIEQKVKEEGVLYAKELFGVPANRRLEKTAKGGGGNKFAGKNICFGGKAAPPHPLAQERRQMFDAMSKRELVHAFATRQVMSNIAEFYCCGGRLRYPYERATSLAQDFLSRVLTAEEDDRMSAAEALKHPWIATIGEREAVAEWRANVDAARARENDIKQKQ